MEELIKMVVDKTGISHEQAMTAVKTVVGFIKDKFPPAIGSQVEAYVNTGNSDKHGNGGLDELSDMMGGMFGKK